MTSVEDAFFLPEDASSNPDTPLHSSVESPPQSDRLSMEPVEAKEGEGWEVIYDDEQEGVSIASSLNYLNNFISTTANTLYNTEVSGLARDLMSTSIEKSKQVYNQVVDMDTTALADSGLGALEKIGEKAMGMFSRTRQDEVKVISDATLVSPAGSSQAHIRNTTINLSRNLINCKVPLTCKHWKAYLSTA